MSNASAPLVNAAETARAHRIADLKAEVRAIAATGGKGAGLVLPFGLDPGLIHVICDRIVDYTDMLRRIGRMDFPHRPGPGDSATHGGSPDRGDKGWQPKGRDSLHRPFRTGMDPEEAVLRQKSRDFD